MSLYIIGEFRDSGSVAAAIQALSSRGIDIGELDLFSSEPVELPPGLLDRPSRMSLFAVVGAATLCLTAMAFVGYTQYDFPLITGGMPLFSLWANGVIFYEMTMLGGIATTFLLFLWESGLLRKSSAPIPMAQPGLIHLRLRCEADQVMTAGECLYRSGAVKVTKAEKHS